MNKIHKLFIVVTVILNVAVVALGATGDYQAYTLLIGDPLHSVSLQPSAMGISYKRTPINVSYPDALSSFNQGSRDPVAVAAATISALTQGNADLYVAVSLKEGKYGITEQELRTACTGLRDSGYGAIVDARMEARYDIGTCVYVDVTLVSKDNQRIKDGICLFPLNGMYYQTKAVSAHPLVRQLLNILNYENEHGVSLALGDTTSFAQQVAIRRIFNADAGPAVVNVYFNGGPPQTGAEVFGGLDGTQYIVAEVGSSDRFGSEIIFFRETWKLLSEIKTDPPFPNDTTTLSFIARFTSRDQQSLRRIMASPDTLSRYREARLQHMRITYIIDAGPLKYIFWEDEQNKYRAMNSVVNDGSGLRMNGVSGTGMVLTMYECPEYADLLFPNISAPPL